MQWRGRRMAFDGQQSVGVVERVGKRWAVIAGAKCRFDLDDCEHYPYWEIDGGAYLSPGRVWPSAEAAAEGLRVETAWQAISDLIRHQRAPMGLTADEAEGVLALLRSKSNG